MVYKIVTILGVVYEIGSASFDNSGAIVEAIEYEHSSLDPQLFVVVYDNGLSVTVHNPVETWRRPERPSPWASDRSRQP